MKKNFFSESIYYLTHLKNSNENRSGPFSKLPVQIERSSDKSTDQFMMVLDYCMGVMTRRGFKAGTNL